MKTHAQIECPSCSELTDVNAENFVCDTCQNSLAGYIYNKHKSLSTTITNTLMVISLTTLGVIKVDKYLDTQYPIGYEYYIVSACVGLDNSPLGEELYREKQKICICAYDKVTKQFHYNETKKPEYQNAFSKSMDECGIESQNQPTLYF